MVKESKEFNFEQDEKVLCYHGPFIYEAKAIHPLSLFNV
jgi:mortality factor 4-like protein 1